MATADTYPHVILNADGEASIEGTRYTVEHIAAELTGLDFLYQVI